MKNKLLKRIAASTLSLVLCFCTMCPITVFAVDESEEFPYGITSEQDISVEELEENDNQLADMKTQAEQYRFGVDFQGYNPVYGKLLSPFQLTSEEKLVEISMDKPQRGEIIDEMDDEFGLKLAVQNSCDGAAVHFFPVEIADEKVTAEIPLTNGSTVLCALVSFQETQATTAPLSTNEFEQSESIVENAEGSLVQYTWKFQISEETGSDNGILGGTYLSTDAEIRLDLGALTLNPSSVTLTTNEGTKWSAFDIGEIKETADGSGVWIIELITPSNVPDNAQIKDQDGYEEVTLSFDAVLSHEDFIKDATFPVIAELGISQTLTSMSGGGAILGMANVDFDQSPVLTPAVTVTPADLTIYQGGDGGYDAVVGGNGTEGETSTSLPHPLFKITPSASASNTKVTDLVFNTDDNSKSWTPVYAGEDAEGNELYYFQEAEGTPAVRVTYTNGDDEPVLNDDFVVGEDVDNTYAEYRIDLYPGENESDFSNIKAGTYPISVNSGTLTVRAVENKVDPTSDIVATDPTTKLAPDTATAVAPADTTYTLNDTGVKIPAVASDSNPDGSMPSLLFDDIISSDGKGDERIDKLEAAAGAWLDQNAGTASGTRNYQIKYLDLVDANNGNAWIKASNPVTIYWGYPATTDQNTTFKLLHFEDLHRDTSGGDNTGFDPDDIANSKIETIAVTNNSNGISFTVGSGGFSPFVLVWETAAEPTPDPDPNPGGGSGGGSDSDPTGNLTISLGGNGGNEDFIFTVIFTDEDGDELENNFYYNGDYTGTIGSGDEITLTGGDKIVIRNLPEGTRYEVIIETADGYTATSTGAEGVIRTSGNEAAFSVTPTVVLADPSVTGVTRWLNTTDHMAYLSGYPGGTFGPDNSMTRAEVAQMFYALLLNKDVTITKTFSDVPADAWYATAVNTLASLGMVSGDPDGTFRPNDPITRAEFCVIALAFAYEPDNAVCYFGDVSRSDWFYTYVAQAASYGWIGGYTNGNFGPNDQITRAQVTTIVNNMLGRAADRDYVIDHQADLVQFSDLTRAHWGYFQVMEATNAHDYTKSNGTESWR